MSILIQLNDELKNAMKGGDVSKREVIKLVKADIQQTVTSGKERREPTDSDALVSIRRIITVKNEIADNLCKVGRIDESKAALNDIVILEAFLPNQLSDDDIRKISEGIMKDKNLDKHMKSMGIIIKELASKYEGQYENAKASAIIKSIITG